MDAGEGLEHAVLIQFAHPSVSASEVSSEFLDNVSSFPRNEARSHRRYSPNLTGPACQSSHSTIVPRCTSIIPSCFGWTKAAVVVSYRRHLADSGGWTNIHDERPTGPWREKCVNHLHAALTENHKPSVNLASEKELIHRLDYGTEIYYDPLLPKEDCVLRSQVRRMCKQYGMDVGGSLSSVPVTSHLRDRLGRIYDLFCLQSSKKHQFRSSYKITVLLLTVSASPGRVS